MTETRWGISYPSGERGGELPDLLEVDASVDLKSVNAANIVLRFSHWYFSSVEEAEHFERVQSLIDQIQGHKPLASVVSIAGNALVHPRLTQRVNALIQRTKDLKFVLYFDFGKNTFPSWIDPQACVYDPMWFEGEPWSSYWKIHGWHAQRWVRMYSPDQLSQLVKLAARHHPQFVVMGHSQRQAQWSSLKKLFPK